jgi:hypothetical protein
VAAAGARPSGDDTRASFCKVLSAEAASLRAAAGAPLVRRSCGGGGAAAHLGEPEDDVHLVGQRGVVVLEHLGEDLAQQVVVLLEQRLVDLERELGHVRE